MTGIKRAPPMAGGHEAVGRQREGRPGGAASAPGFKRSRWRLFIHGAVSRDMLEPATASFAHRKIGLPATAQIFDLSNACLGFLNALVTLGP
jgi:hypothetical protein